MCLSKCCSVPWKHKRSALPAAAMTDQSQPAAAPPIFHEKQRLQLCLLHSLNNLYQGQIFTRSELNSIACSLPSEIHSGGPLSCLFSNHYNILTGNYDANVLMRALQKQGAEINFCNQRRGVDAIDLDDPRLVGFIFHHQIEKILGWKGGHWAAVKKINGAWFDLDSYLAEPEAVGNNDEVRHFISQMFDKGSEVIRVLNTV